MINHVLVLGCGSAGFLVAITLKHRLPQLRVTVLRSKEIGIIGVGESTTIPLVNHLHDYLRIDLTEFYRLVQPTHKPTSWRSAFSGLRDRISTTA